MTKREERRPRPFTPMTPLYLGLLLALAGCGSAPTSTASTRQSGAATDTDDVFGSASGDGDEAGDGDDADDSDDEADGNVPPRDDGPSDPVDVPEGDACAEEAQAALVVLENRCASCHANGARNGGFGEALDLDAMVARGFVVPGSLGASEIYEVTESGEMPLGSSDLSAAELGALEDWILCLPEDGAVPPGAGGGNVGDDDDDDDEEVDDDDDDLDDEAEEDADDAAEEAAEDDDDAAEEAAEDADDAAEEAAEDDDDAAEEAEDDD